MTRFINGYHCPKLAQLIVQKLRHLLAHPELEQIPSSRDMYKQLLDHWQYVTHFLLEQKAADKKPVQHH